MPPGPAASSPSVCKSFVAGWLKRPYDSTETGTANSYYWFAKFTLTKIRNKCKRINDLLSDFEAASHILLSFCFQEMCFMLEVDRVLALSKGIDS
jgi:hypothetical protein